MTWLLKHEGRVVARGLYGQLIETAEEWRVLERGWHADGTEFAPRWLVRGYSLMPAPVVSARGRRAAA